MYSRSRIVSLAILCHVSKNLLLISTRWFSLVRVSGGKCVRNWCSNVKRTKLSNDSRSPEDKYIILTRRFRFGQYPKFWEVNIEPDISLCIRSDTFRLRSERETGLRLTSEDANSSEAGRNLTPPVNKKKYTYTATDCVPEIAQILKIKDFRTQRGKFRFSSFKERMRSTCCKIRFIEPASPGITPCAELPIQGRSKAN